MIFNVGKLLRLGIVSANLEDYTAASIFASLTSEVYRERKLWEQFSSRLMCSKGRITKFYFFRKIKFQLIFNSNRSAFFHIIRVKIIQESNLIKLAFMVVSWNMKTSFFSSLYDCTADLFMVSSNNKVKRGSFGEKAEGSIPNEVNLIFSHLKWFISFKSLSSSSVNA